jgi:tetratricopeptide (TPR) repeat protein
VNKSISKLKEQARIHEQNEDWVDAIKAYQQALRIGEEGEGEVELSLLNRIGDLFLRAGKEDDAIQYYELAADRYEAAGLFNSAIALCNKVIRQDAARPEPYYRLGRLTLAQGFLSEARRWSVEYAERMLRAGKRTEAFAALNEFASHAADPEIRELLAQYLLAHGETAEALSQLLEAYRARVDGNQPDKARELREKILALDPKLDLSAFEGTSPAASLPSVQPGAPEVEVRAIAAAEESDAEWAAEADLLPGLIDDSGLLDTPDDDSAPELPELLLQTTADSAGIAEAGVDTGVIDTEAIDIGTGPEPVPPVALDLTIAVTPTAIELEMPLLDLELAGADLPTADPEMPDTEMADTEMGGTAAVDLAAAIDDDDAASASLAGALLYDLPDTAAPDSRLDTGPASAPKPAGGAGYVDFGALLQDDDDAEQGLTRYTVDAPTPSGDEDRDFLDMLSQFKSKVSEHLGDDDAQSRYDLGLAFKEMGLYDEAISQFQIALRGMEDQLKIYEELGDCFIQKGDYTVALKILKGALAMATTTGGAELIGVHYQLARSYEELGRTDDARDAYERVIVVDLEFRDAAARLGRL